MAEPVKHVAEVVSQAVTYGGSTMAVGSAGSLIFGLTTAEWSFVFGAIGATCAVLGLAYTVWSGERRQRNSDGDQGA